MDLYHAKLPSLAKCRCGWDRMVVNFVPPHAAEVSCTNPDCPNSQKREVVKVQIQREPEPGGDETARSDRAGRQGVLEFNSSPAADGGAGAA